MATILGVGLSKHKLETQCERTNKTYEAFKLRTEIFNVRIVKIIENEKREKLLRLVKKRTSTLYTI